MGLSLGEGGTHFLNYKFMYAHEYVYVCTRVQCSRRTEEGVVSPGTGIIDSFNSLGTALGTEFRSSAPAECSLNHCTFSPAPAA